MGVDVDSFSSFPINDDGAAFGGPYGTTPVIWNYWT
jgi:hypothetical protein